MVFAEELSGKDEKPKPRLLLQQKTCFPNSFKINAIEKVETEKETTDCNLIVQSDRTFAVYTLV